MQFNSLSFAVFLAGALLLYYLPSSWRVRKFNLLCASYLFYMAWNPPFVAITISSRRRPSARATSRSLSPERP